MGSQDIQSVTQVDVFIIECERTRRAKDFHHVERGAKGNDQNQPFPSIDVSHEYAKSSGTEDAGQAEKEKAQGIIIIESMKARVVCRRYQRQPRCGAEHDNINPRELYPGR